MEQKKHNPEAETQVTFVNRIQEKVAQLQKEQQTKENNSRLGIQNTVPQFQTPLSNEPTKKIKNNSRAGIAATLALGLMTSSAAAATGYMYLYNKGPFSNAKTTPAETAIVSTANDEPAKEPVSTEVTTNEDLAKILKAENIHATSKDFNYPTETPLLHARALILKMGETPENDTDLSYQWIPVREKITRVKENELLVAVKVVNRYIKNNPSRHIAPEGLTYRAMTTDTKDPTVLYFYYDCRDKKNTDLLGQIGLKNPQNPNKLLWGVSFSIPDCE